MDIYGQIFSWDGSKLGPEFVVNNLTAGNQGTPDVTVLEDQSYVVSWHSHIEMGDNDENNSNNPVLQDVYARVFSPTMNVYNLNAGELDQFNISIPEDNAYAFDFNFNNEVNEVKIYKVENSSGSYSTGDLIYSSNNENNTNLNDLYAKIAIQGPSGITDYPENTAPIIESIDAINFEENISTDTVILMLKPLIQMVIPSPIQSLVLMHPMLRLMRMMVKSGY